MTTTQRTHPFGSKALLPWAVSILLGCASLSAGAQFTGVAPDYPSAAQKTSGEPAEPVPNDVKLQPGDNISVSVFGVPEISFTRLVSNHGTIDIPGIGNIQVVGLTTEDAEKLLRERAMAVGLLTDPQFLVTTLTSPTSIIAVLGEVKEPKPVPTLGQIRLFDALSFCGGVLPTASSVVVVNRRGVPDPIHILLTADPDESRIANIYLRAGDTVIVPRVGVIYAIGQVKLPQAIPFAGPTPLTLTEALARAGGLNYGAALSKTVIARRVNGIVTAIPVDLQKVLDRKQADIVLRPDDIVYVPSNAFKASLAAGGAAVLAQAATAIGVLR